MNKTADRPKLSRASGESARLDANRLRALIDQATSDSYDESDEHAGLLGMIREEVACPFRARVQGEDVECVRFEWPKVGDGLNAICRSQKGKSRTVDIGSLEWTDPLPKGHEWIEAYLAWRKLVGS
ncbi:MAG: hypothetical protein JO161_10105 [Planctomycetaceae bacterium]|nr:hypothetical protein [Planctomycetaceae bacterium]